MVFIKGVNQLAFIEGFRRRQVIVSIHVTSSTQKVESQNMDRVEDGTHDAIISITQTVCMNLKYQMTTISLYYMKVIFL